MSPNLPLYLALALYATGTVAILLTLFRAEGRLQSFAFFSMIGGFVAHTVWIGVICSRTEHPPLTNLPEAAAFIAWTIFAVELGLHLRYKVQAATFFVYPLVLLLLTLSAAVREPLVPLDPPLHSALFISHIFLSTVGVAALLVGLTFVALYRLQERALKAKVSGTFYDRIPSLQICEVVSYRALAIGFSIYTVGLLMGILWSYRTEIASPEIRPKEIAAIAAWLIFGALLQTYVSGSYRREKSVYLSAAAFLSLVVVILGIHRG